MAPDFSSRSRGQEMMDDFSIVDARLEEALENLRQVNRFLGGYTSVRRAIAPFLRQHRGRVHLLDLGTGGADTPEYLVRWADRQGLNVRVTGLEANPATVRYARHRLDERLPPRLRRRIEVVNGDALAPPFQDGEVDVVVAALFLHHFHGRQAADLLAVMHRLARYGIVVSDLHRHPLAYWSIQAVGKLLPVSPMFAHDGPLSVLRGFKRDELVDLAAEAGLPSCDLRWQWAFRWVLSTLER